MLVEKEQTRALRSRSFRASATRRRHKGGGIGNAIIRGIYRRKKDESRYFRYDTQYAEGNCGRDGKYLRGGIRLSRALLRRGYFA